MTDPETTANGEERVEVKRMVHKTGAAAPGIGGCLAVRPGQLCPVCGKGMMNYNGLLILSCPVCGFNEPGGGFT